MSKVVDEFRIRQYAVLKLDKMPQVNYRKYRIGTEEFEPVPIYDLPRGRKIFCVYGKNSSLIRNRYV